MCKYHRITILLLLFVFAMFNSVTWGQKNYEIYNLEANWEKTVANYKRDLEASKEKIRYYENELRKARQEESELVSGQSSVCGGMGQDLLSDVRIFIGDLEESIAFEKRNILRIEELINNGRQDLAFKKQQIERGIEEAKRQRKAEEEKAQRQKKQRQNNKNSSRSMNKKMSGTTIKGQEQRMNEFNNYYDNLKREAAEKKRRHEEEDRRRREEIKENTYRSVMASTEASHQRNLAYADQQRENMQYLRNAKIDNIEMQSGYIPSSGNSTMTAQKRSKAGIFPKKKIDLKPEINENNKIIKEYSNTNTNNDHGYYD